MPEKIEVSESLIEIVEAASERAFGWLQTDESFMGFLVVEAKGLPLMPVEHPSKRAFGAPLVLAQDDAALRDFIVENRTDVAAYAIVFDVVLTHPQTGEDTAAVRIEAAERGGANGLVFIETYVKSRPETPPERSRRFAVVQVVENLLAKSAVG